MAKTKRGLPAGYAFDIPTEGPVRLGDYLDEFAAARPAAVAAPASGTSLTPEKVVEVALPSQKTVAAGRKEGTSIAKGAPVHVVHEDAAVHEEKPAARTRPNYPRMEINLSAQAQRMVHEIIENVQQYSVQHNAKASEVFQAMVEVLYRSLNRIEYAQVPRRGKWGTPTAAAFRVALGEAFAKAIVEWYQQERV